jgi:amino acid transporter
MTPPRIAGIVLLIVGIILLIVGLNASHSFADQLSNTFTGKFTDSTAWYIYGGLAAAIAGACLTFFGARKTT